MKMVIECDKRTNSTRNDEASLPPPNKEAAAVPPLDSFGVTEHFLAGVGVVHRQRVFALLQR